MSARCVVLIWQYSLSCFAGVSQPSWLRNESYKDVSLSFQTDQHEIVDTDSKQYSSEQAAKVHQFGHKGSKRTLVDISSSDEERQLYQGKGIKKECPNSTEKVTKHHKDKKKHKSKKKHKHKKVMISDESDLKLKISLN